VETPGGGSKVDDNIDLALAGIQSSLDELLFVNVLVPLDQIHLVVSLGQLEAVVPEGCNRNAHPALDVFELVAGDSQRP